MSANETKNLKLLKLEDVLEIIPISKTSWYRIVEKNKNLKPVKIGRCSFWKQEKIKEYIDNL